MQVAMKSGKQTIRCDVASCLYNEHQNCGLDGITVAPQRDAKSGKACDETQCASYKLG